MTNLNFYPYYEQLLRKKEKYATIRVGNKLALYHVGDFITITVGWDEKDKKNIKSISRAKIIAVDCKPIKDITKKDLEGESPDCSSKKSVPYVLSSIYRRVITNDDLVTIIRWKYLN